MAPLNTITPKTTTVKGTFPKTSEDDSNCAINNDLNYCLENDLGYELDKAPGYDIDDNTIPTLMTTPAIKRPTTPKANHGYDVKTGPTTASSTSSVFYLDNGTYDDTHDDDTGNDWKGDIDNPDYDFEGKPDDD